MSGRIVISGTNSGAGKTTVATGLIGALRRVGHTVQGFKVGPDYIDPSYHALASGRPGRNLDAFLYGPELIAPLFAHGATGADIAVIEGVMGLFDGASGRGELASTAHVAKLLDAPVLLVVNGSAMARSAAAVIHGFATFDPALRVAGVIFNQVGSPMHETLLREAAETVGVPVLGALRRDGALAVPERHLGLVPAAERDTRNRELLDALAGAVGAQVDLEAVRALAASAPPLDVTPWSPAAGDRPAPASTRRPAPLTRGDKLILGRGFSPEVEDGDPAIAVGPAPGGNRPPHIAIARGPAFSFHYEENLELLTAAGAELVGFDPLTDPQLPPGSDALVLAGGFPEVYGAELAANETLKQEIADFGGPILAECGGLLYLGERLDGHAMCGRLPIQAEMTGRLRLGYREATVATATSWLDRGDTVRGHEFHYSQVQLPDETLTPAWQLGERGPDGVADAHLQAGYLHVHWAAYPEIPRRFVAAARTPAAARISA